MWNWTVCIFLSFSACIYECRRSETEKRGLFSCYIWNNKNWRVLLGSEGETWILQGLKSYSLDNISAVCLCCKVPPKEVQLFSILWMLCFLALATSAGWVCQRKLRAEMKMGWGRMREEGCLSDSTREYISHLPEIPPFHHQSWMGRSKVYPGALLSCSMLLSCLTRECAACLQETSGHEKLMNSTKDLSEVLAKATPLLTRGSAVCGGHVQGTVGIILVFPCLSVKCQWSLAQLLQEAKSAVPVPRINCSQIKAVWVTSSGLVSLKKEKKEKEEIQYSATFAIYGSAERHGKQSLPGDLSGPQTPFEFFNGNPLDTHFALSQSLAPRNNIM